jgi:hypothetical protein
MLRGKREKELDFEATLRGDPVMEEVVVMGCNGWSFYCEHIEEQNFHNATHMTKEEMRRIVGVLVVALPDSETRALTRQDRVFLLICTIAKNHTYGDMFEYFRVGRHLVDILLNRDLPVLAAWIDEHWIPAVDSQAHQTAFDRHPWAACAVDSTPLVMANGEKRHRYLSKALWSEKKHVVCWKVHFFVTPNCICVGWGIGAGQLTFVCCSMSSSCGDWSTLQLMSGESM